MKCPKCGFEYDVYDYPYDYSYDSCDGESYVRFFDCECPSCKASLVFNEIYYYNAESSELKGW